MANLIIPYPETENWYLSLQLLCPESPEYVTLGPGNEGWWLGAQVIAFRTMDGVT
jgi:hypothetical protein